MKAARRLGVDVVLLLSVGAASGCGLVARDGADAHGASAGGGGSPGAGQAGAVADSAGDAGAVASSGGAGASSTAGASGSRASAGSAGCLTGDVAVVAATVSGNLTINGAAIVGTTGDEGSSVFNLRSASGDNAPLGLLSRNSSTYSALVVQGSYDLYYQNANPGSAVAGNTLVKLKSGIVVGPDPLSLDIDVPATRVTGTITVNGAVLGDASQGWGSLSLRRVVAEDAAGDYALLGSTAQNGGSYSALVVPGTYDLYYSGDNRPGITIPFSSSAKLRSGIVVGTSALSLDIDVPVSTVSGTVSASSAVFDDLGAGHSYLSLYDSAGEAVRLTVGAGGSYDPVRVVPGTYDVYYGCDPLSVTGGPSNPSVKIQTGIVVGAAPLSLDIAVPAAVTVSGQVTLNGAPLQDLLGELAPVTLADAQGNQVPLLIKPADGSYSARVAPGTYDVYYGGYGGGSVTLRNAPSNVSAKLKSGVVVGTAPLSLDIDIPETAVSGTITVDGQPIQNGALKQFTFTLKDEAGASAEFSPALGSFSTLVIPGTYDFYYRRQEGSVASRLPSNISAKIRSNVVVGSSPLTLDVDIATAIVSGVITVNGATSFDSPNDVAEFLVLDADGNGARLANVGFYSSRLIPGTYELYYGVSGGSTLPSNHHADLGCFIVP